MNPKKPRPIVYVDVDDTLIRTVGTKRIPMPAAIARVRELHAAGCPLYLWSSGGAEYAAEVASQLELKELFVAILPKPNIYIDDQEVSEWRTCRHGLPGADVLLD